MRGRPKTSEKHQRIGSDTTITREEARQLHPHTEGLSWEGLTETAAGKTPADRDAAASCTSWGRPPWYSAVPVPEGPAGTALASTR